MKGTNQRPAAYIVARLWDGFPEGFPIKLFDDIPDSRIRATLDYLSAVHVLESDDADEELVPWAQHTVGLVPDCVPAVDATARMQIYRGFGGFAYYGWSTILGARSDVLAQSVAAALPNVVSFDGAISLKVLLAADLPQATWLACQRDLDGMEAEVRDLEKSRSQGGASVQLSAFQKLHVEALRLAGILDRYEVVGGAPVPDREEGAELKDKIYHACSGPRADRKWSVCQELVKLSKGGVNWIAAKQVDELGISAKTIRSKIQTLGASGKSWRREVGSGEEFDVSKLLDYVVGDWSPRLQVIATTASSVGRLTPSHPQAEA